MRRDAHGLGLHAERDDLTLELVADLLEGTDAGHVKSPFCLEEPATAAASMAIERPVSDRRRIRNGRQRAGGRRPKNFVIAQGMRVSARGGFVIVTAGRLRVAQHAQVHAAIRPGGRATRPMPQSVSACKLGG